MKKILITSETSYIGNSLKQWLTKWNKNYYTEKISTREKEWKEKDFSKYDVVIHVAGIAHKKERRKDREKYFTVNRDLTYEVALKAKNEGVEQFIFVSTMSIYGVNKGEISNTTTPKPTNTYGKSKLEGEKMLSLLNSSTFTITIVRPPMVYGKECKGNYRKLRKLALKFPIFPEIQNCRSMVYIDNFCEFTRFLIDRKLRGVYFPQNPQYVCTSEMVKLIAEVNGKKMRLTKIFNPILKNLNLVIINKMFSDLYYTIDSSEVIDAQNYCFIGLEHSIRLTEGYSEKDINIIKSS